MGQACLGVKQNSLLFPAIKTRSKMKPRSTLLVGKAMLSVLDSS
jgi:hypothetical protein